MCMQTMPTKQPPQNTTQPTNDTNQLTGQPTNRPTCLISALSIPALKPRNHQTDCWLDTRQRHQDGYVRRFFINPLFHYFMSLFWGRFPTHSSAPHTTPHALCDVLSAHAYRMLIGGVRQRRHPVSLLWCAAIWDMPPPCMLGTPTRPVAHAWYTLRAYQVLGMGWGW